MRFSLLSSLLVSGLLLSLIGARAHAAEFSCRTTSCVIPYNSEGVADGTEVCYTDSTKKEKAKELSWKKGVRQGPARCFENGKLTVQVNFDRNEIDGLRVDKRSDSRGDRYTRYERGRQLGFQFFADEAGKVTDVWKCFKDEKLDESSNSECLRADYGAFQAKLKAVFAERFKEEQERLKKLNGPQESKYENGKTREKYTMKNGDRVGESVSYFANGQLHRKENFSNGLPDGASVTFDEQGHKQFDSVYKHGQLLSQTEYRNNGFPSRERVWANGTVCETTFYDNGRKLSYDCRVEATWRHADGPTKDWDIDGHLIGEGQYKNGEAVGVWRYFEEDGSVREELYFKNGRMEKLIHFDGEGGKTIREYMPDGSLRKEQQIPKTTSM